MEALSVDAVPAGPEWQYEPKWDGFRCLVFRDGDTVTLQSKSGKPLTRYFPDVVEAVKALGAGRFVLDGEIVVPDGKVFSFDALLQRIHPAASRIKTLSESTPALLIVFDLLADTDGVLTSEALPIRRKRLEAFARKHFKKTIRVRLSPSTTKFVSEASNGSCRNRCNPRRHCRQAARCAVLVRRPSWHAEDQELSQR